MQEDNSNTTFVREIKIDDYEKDTADNTLLIVESSNLQYGTGAKVWEASVCLAKTLAYLQDEHAYSFKGKTVLELGCGAGLLALFMGALGAKVIATDLPIIQGLFTRNLNNNRNIVKQKVEFRQYNWNQQPDCITEQIDYILISEGFTSEETMNLVLKRLEQLLHKNKSCTAFISFKIKHHNLNQFQERLDQLQLEGQKLAAQDYNPEYYDARTIIYVVRSSI